MQYAPFRPRRALLAALVAGLCHGTVHAEDALQQITVTASPLVENVPSSAATLNREELHSRAPVASDTARMLSGTPGLSLQGAGGVSSLPVIHGMADDRLRVKVDGMDLISACGNHMNPPLSYIAPSNLAEATVFAGIAPVSLGGDSIGGTIVAESAPAEFAASGETLQSGEVGAYYRSNGNVVGGNLGATLASDRFSMSYNGSTVEAENYEAGDDFKPAGPAAAGRGWLSGDEVGSTMYEATNHALTLAAREENHLVELKLGLQDIPYQGWPNQRMDMTGNDSTQVNLRYAGGFDWGVLEARAYREHTRHSMQFYDDKLYWYGPMPTAPATDGIPGPIGGGKDGYAAGMPMDTEGENIGTALKADIQLSARDLLRVGAETQHYRLDDWWDPSGKGMWPDTFWNINDGERDRLAAFAEWEAQWNRTWLTQLGLRYERVNMDAGEVQGYSTMSSEYLAESTAFNAADRDISDNNLDFVALARFTPDAAHSIEVGYARKTRSPNLYERYTWSTGGMAMRMINLAGDGNGYVGNLELEPEVAHTVSATFEWRDAAEQRWNLRLTPYYTRIEDYIDARRCVSANPNCGPQNQTDTEAFVYLQFVNQSAKLYGFDLSGEQVLAEKTAYGDFSLGGQLSYVRGENRTTGDNLYNIMPLNATITLDQSLGNWNNALELELVDEKDRLSQVRNELPTDSYALLHLRSSYQWDDVRFDFGVENLLDEYYEHPLGGVYTGQGKTMSSTGVAWGTPVPGMGRSFYAGVNYAF